MQTVSISLDSIKKNPSEIKTLKAAESIVGGLSNPSKMPSCGTSLPAQNCNVGSKLRNVKGSVCEKCYAMKGCYAWDSTKEALSRRLDCLNNDAWVTAMVFIMTNKAVIRATGVFRWHDSGDLQSYEHLLMIVAVAKLTPWIKHWVPTKEKGLLSRYLREFGKLPTNLVIRVSGAMIDGNAPNGFRNTSTVTSDQKAATCRAFLTEKLSDGSYRKLTLKQFNALPAKHGRDLGHCGDCRKCWNSRIANVSYHVH